MKTKKLTDEQVLFLYNKYYLKGLYPRQIEKMEDCPCSDTTLERAFKRLNLKIRDNSLAQRKFKVNEDFFEQIDTPEKAWLLGFIAADGNVNPSNNTLNIVLASEDEEILVKIKSLLDSEHRISRIKARGNRQEAVVLTIGSKKIFQDLNKIGIIPNKTFLYVFPEFLSKELIRHFIRGYFDGDGSIWWSKKRKRMSFSITANYWFNDTLKLILKKELGIKTYSYFRHQDKGNLITQQLYVSGNLQIKKLMNWLYEDSTIHLKRKFDKFNTYIDYIYNTMNTKHYNTERGKRVSSNARYLSR